MKTDTTFDKIQRVLYKDKKEAVQYLTSRITGSRSPGGRLH